MTTSFAPPKSPSSLDCADALVKGLGRAALWAESKRLDLAQLMHACVTDLRYDQQCEDSRASWLWMLVEKSGYRSECEDVVWQSINAMEDERSVEQLCELAMHFSLGGRDRFTRRLFEIVRDKPTDGDLTIGEYQLIVAAGLDGFHAAARKRGERLCESEWDWDDDWFLQRSASIFGQAVVLQHLESSTDSGVQRFNSHRLRHAKRKEASSERISQRATAQSKTVDDVLAAARSDDRCFWFRRWGVEAEQGDIDTVFEHLLQCDDSDEVSRLIKVFMKRELPRVEPILFQHCWSTNPDLALFSLRALARKTDPAVRQLGLECLQTQRVSQAIELLTSNFQPGDEKLIAGAIVAGRYADDRHGLMMACRSFLEENVEADALPLALHIYRETPCSLCRAAAVKVLKRQDKAPDWMVEETQLDCDELSREHFHPKADSTPTMLDARLNQLRSESG